MAQTDMGSMSQTRPKKRSLFNWLVGAETTFQAKDALQGYLFALPWILGLLIFVGGPMLASLGLSFTEYSILGRPQWIGLDNYARAFTRDDLFYTSLWRTFYFTLLFVPASMIGSLFLALLLNQQLVGRNIYRTIFFVPHLTPDVALAVIWLWLLNPTLGPVNYALDWLGLPESRFLTGRDTVIPSLTMIAFWATMGGNRMLIFLAGLQGVPNELYEAADIDGASVFSKFWNITLPMISPVMLFNVILGVIGALNVFNLAFVATQGGPSYGSWFFALHIYQQAFVFSRLGYGSALAWILAVVLILITLSTLRLSDRWVFYQGGK
ncbi:MAG: sugar ABC transporter permease [Litorilinea sp.]